MVTDKGFLCFVGLKEVFQRFIHSSDDLGVDCTFGMIEGRHQLMLFIKHIEYESDKKN